MNHSDILQATQPALNRRLAELEQIERTAVIDDGMGGTYRPGVIISNMTGEADLIRRELARRYGCAG